MFTRLLYAAILLIFFYQPALTQSVGIGTSNPNSSAALEIRSTDKGVLFPRLTSAQRDAIANPADGLHIFNLNDKCLNYYDSAFKVWNCYCQLDTCRVITIRVGDGNGIDFYSAYADEYPPAKKYVVLIDPGVVITGTVGLSFASMPNDATIRIINYGSLTASGGSGGAGGTGQSGSCQRFATAGAAGGSAIATRAGVVITVENHGLITAGGGGGGGGGRNAAGEYGGGGGGGAGNGAGGQGGGTTFMVITSCVTSVSVAQNGIAGLATTGGNGGAGANGGSAGGAGGSRGQAGQNALGTSAGIGGPPGKAISGGTGNMIFNIGTGQVIGAVD
jgi:hypothetical protein